MQWTWRTTLGLKEGGDPKVKGRTIKGIRKEYLMLGRGKIPLEERKIQVERGEEIDAIWKKNNPKQMGDPNPQKKTQNKRVSQTQLKIKNKKKLQ